MNIIKTVTIDEKIKLSGYDGEYVFKRIEDSQTFYEKTLLEKWFNSSEANIVYDIGGNIGNHAVYFAMHSTNAKIYTFEPIIDNFRILEKNIHDNDLSDRIIAQQVAIGETSGKVSMQFTQEGNFGTAQVLTDNDIKTGSYNVDILSIDGLRLPLPDFVKIDVEGFELSVLRGMISSLLQSKENKVWIEVDSKTSDDVFRLMDELGYFVVDYDLSASNNVLWKNYGERIFDDSSIFSIALSQAEIARSRYWATKETGEFKSKFVYEQKKADDLKKQLENMVSKYLYEQKKANDFKSQVNTLSSKYEYERVKASNLTESLTSTTNLLEAEYKKTNELEISNKNIRYDLNNKQEMIESWRDKANSLASKFEYEQNKANTLLNEKSKMQKELDMFNNSKMISFMRFWIWKVPTVAKRRLRFRVNKMGKWAYIKLLPYPKVRKFLSKANSRLKIYKNPQALLISEPQKNENINLTNTLSIEKIKKAPKDYNVAAIVDEFTFNSFKYECNLLPLEPDNWKSIFEQNNIDFFFCESAWAGVDSVKRPWRGKIYASSNFKTENRTVLLEILAYCKEKNIPTVFWNKEDPTHYTDRIHDFVKTALLFDHIFTTADECVQMYRDEYGHQSVNLLMFATQPELFNAEETCERTNDIVFAGSWYAQHPDRCAEMEGIFDNIIRQGYTLKIYNRHSDNDDPNHKFPDKYEQYIYPRLEHNQLGLAYKESKYALNINTVVESETMFARRVFELMSSNTLVLTNYSMGIDNIFGNNVLYINNESIIDFKDADFLRMNNLKEVIKNHTYEERFKQILKILF